MLKGTILKFASEEMHKKYKIDAQSSRQTSKQVSHNTSHMPSHLLCRQEDNIKTDFIEIGSEGVD